MYEADLFTNCEAAKFGFKDYKKVKIFLSAFYKDVS